jgi:NagD protein
LSQIDAHAETTAMVGDRMDTDIRRGDRGGAHDLLRPDRLHTAGGGEPLPYRPAQVMESTANLVEL